MAEPLQELPSEAVDALRKGNKIEAIRILRLQNHGIGLKEAKDAVDAYVAARPDLGAQLQAASAGGSRFLILVLAVLGAALILYWFLHR